MERQIHKQKQYEITIIWVLTVMLFIFGGRGGVNEIVIEVKYFDLHCQKQK